MKNTETLKPQTEEAAINEKLRVISEMLVNDIVRNCTASTELATEILNTQKPTELMRDNKVIVHGSTFRKPAVSVQWPDGRFTAPQVAEQIGLRGDTIRDLAEKAVRRGEARKVGRVHSQGRAYIYERVPEAGQRNNDTEALVEMPKAA